MRCFCLVVQHEPLNSFTTVFWTPDHDDDRIMHGSFCRFSSCMHKQNPILSSLGRLISGSLCLLSCGLRAVCSSWVLFVLWRWFLVWGLRFRTSLCYSCCPLWLLLLLGLVSCSGALLVVEFLLAMYGIMVYGMGVALSFLFHFYLWIWLGRRPFDGWMASESTSNQYSGRFIIKTGWDNFTNLL